MSSIVEEHAQYIEKRWTHEGIECAILGHPRFGHLNGYVQVPRGVELPLDEYGDPIVDAHGGITYGLDEEGWIGFDTAHAGDYWPDRPDPYGLNDLYAHLSFPTEWTFEKLVAEVERLAEQVKGIPDRARPRVTARVRYKRSRA